MPNKTNTRTSGLPKLPSALAPLQEQPQWTVWRPVQKNGRVQKPPFLVSNPRRNADPTNPDDWADHASAAAVVAAGEASGLQYILTPEGEVAALDLDGCRNPDTGSISPWAQQYIERAEKAGAYVEASPSAAGIRIIGLTSGGTSKVHSNTRLSIDGKDVGIELFRRTSKAVTITGKQIGKGTKLGNVDALIDWATIDAARRKAAAEKPTQKKKGNGLNGSSSGHSTEDILRIVREGAGDGNRSNLFHTCVGHLHGIGWSEERIREYMQQYPDGIASKFIEQGRLERRGDRIGEVERSISRLPKNMQAAAHAEALEGLKPKRTKTPRKAKQAPAELAEATDAAAGEELVLYAHGSKIVRPPKQWLLKGLIPKRGHGLLSGQSGIGKTFVALDMALAIGTGQPFVGYRVKRQSGTLLFAYEGAGDVEERLNEAVRHKHGGLEQAPFRWCGDQWGEDTAPFLLSPDAIDDLLKACRKAEEELQREHELPLGLIIFDTLTACAGYPPGGGENDSAAAQMVMTVLRRLAQEMDAFVLAIDHIGKNPDGGTRGSSSKEASADLVLALHADKDGSNTRMQIRKNRGGRQWLRYPFTLQEVTAPELDADGEPVGTAIVHWGTAHASGSTVQAPIDPWEASCRRGDQQTRVMLLKQVLLEALAQHGVERPILSDGTMVRLVSEDLVRERFYSCTIGDGTPEQQRKQKFQQFKRALEHAQQKLLAGIHEGYLWLIRNDQQEGDQC